MDVSTGMGIEVGVDKERMGAGVAIGNGIAIWIGVDCALSANNC